MQSSKIKKVTKKRSMSSNVTTHGKLCMACDVYQCILPLETETIFYPSSLLCACLLFRSKNTKIKHGMGRNVLGSIKMASPSFVF